MVLALDLAYTPAAAEGVLASDGSLSLLDRIGGRCRRGHRQQHPGEQEEPPANPTLSNLPPKPHCCTCTHTIEHYDDEEESFIVHGGRRRISACVWMVRPRHDHMANAVIWTGRTITSTAWWDHIRYFAMPQVQGHRTF
ncbi:hypothetical protein SEVIR_8G173140v4 [Setaria viridis]